MGVPVLGQLLAGTCPYAASVSINDRCGVPLPAAADRRVPDDERDFSLTSIAAFVLAS
jgi:hypothetical protein